MSGTAPVFKMKSSLAKNLVLVESPGIESELFVPIIRNGRIDLQNITNRRCFNGKNNISKQLQNSEDCSLRISASDKSLLNSTLQKSLFKKKPVAYSTPLRDSLSRHAEPNKQNYFSSLQSSITTTNNSTLLMPKGLRDSVSKRADTNKENCFPSLQSSISIKNNSTLPTPEVLRRDIVNTHNYSITSIKRLRPEAKIVHLHRNPTPNTPKRVGKVVIRRNIATPANKSTNNSSYYNNDVLNNSSGFILPRSPSINQSISLSHLLNTPASTYKWRKCLTPKRTYCRRPQKNNQQPQKQRSELSMSVKPLKRYVSSTKGIGTSLQMEMRKILIDQKVMITPRTFKKQLKNTDDLNRNTYQLPKKRLQFKRLQYTAFDLLTNSNRLNCISKKLSRLFRNGCINKSSTIDPKYKQLILSIPPLECER